ncbi:MAG: SsrA-binding protein SmpB [Candidatus Omnitrophica bacterium]|nr:SsrA-binding protein SmpB [Candidatus Omnitrophota bacterium]MCA9432824.1 SsrA-binding protein SmpB [Candidatus Omnitrophota bacterium]MCA9439906.1 SsrA-binding protein SmpB [Candidatus Omnitrophota bacterium]MCA9446069.1 SsrA-binding protein SmpB [Candidatus Omnitrophota bacterium]MCB9768380.1 SsrA-binding protein SmpB [Candidatus Omnitrophota bacterium]
MTDRDIARNRKAFHDYHILDKYEAGIQLQGTEVKSLRAGKCNLKDSYAVVMEGELYLLNCHISMYEPAARMNHDPERRRKLLMRRKEIDLLFGKTQQKGLTLIPLRMYFKNGVAKVEIGLCKGKQLHDKRAALKDRELKRDAEAAMAKFK